MAAEKFLTNYTEVDTGNYLTVSDPKILATALDQDTNAYVYKDFGANYFDKLDVLFELYLGSGSQTGAEHMLPDFTTALLTKFNEAAAYDLLVSAYKASASVLQIYMYRGNNVAYDGSVNLSLDTIYYCRLERAAGNNTATTKIYSDSGRTTLVDTLSVAGYSTTKWRYAYGFLANSHATTGRDFTGYIQNMDLQEAVATNFQLNIGDTFKTVSAIQVNVGDSWKAITKGQVNLGDTWKSIF